MTKKAIKNNKILYFRFKKIDIKTYLKKNLKLLYLNEINKLMRKFH